MSKKGMHSGALSHSDFGRGGGGTFCACSGEARAAWRAPQQAALHQQPELQAEELLEAQAPLRRPQLVLAGRLVDGLR
jgi:hypothetical protein